MYRHVVLFRFRPELPSETKQKAANEFKEGILNLKGIIPQIRSIEVGFNVNASEILWKTSGSTVHRRSILRWPERLSRFLTGVPARTTWSIDSGAPGLAYFVTS